MCARSVNQPVTPPRSAPLPDLPDLDISDDDFAPRFLRGFIWGDGGGRLLSPAADRSETLRPLPSPPASEWRNEAALDTIKNNPDLFKIVTPVNVDRLEQALERHPNRPLVASVIRGFREGFWPFADFEGRGFPETWDEPGGDLEGEMKEFAERYAQEEETADRYSPVFGTDLLPGMFSMPVYAVPKDGPAKFRLINDHSAGDHALNDAIRKEDVGMPQDNVQHIGHNLLVLREIFGPDAPIWLYKSDVANAYRLLPMHPLWQVKQVITINGRRRIDRCCCFGSRGSPDLWCTVMALVLWIAVHGRDIDGSKAYMDDNHGEDPNPTLVFYAPYGREYPSKQARLLQLWDELGIPHKEPKQVYGRVLSIIGLEVDSDAMTITLPRASATALVDHIRAFLATPGRRPRVREWQRTLGWINWALNVHPLLRPALQSSYAKLAGKQFPRAGMYLNADVHRDLTWVADKVESLDGVHILRARTWSPEGADLTIYCDASLSGLGFWVPSHNAGYMTLPQHRPVAPVDDTIFWLESYSVLSALAWAVSLPTPPRRLSIFTDSLNTVQMFDSLRAFGDYNVLLRTACDILMDSGIDLRVWHVPGAENIIADALSRSLFHVLAQYVPDLSLYTFIPPPVPAGGRS